MWSRCGLCLSHLPLCVHEVLFCFLSLRLRQHLGKKGALENQAPGPQALAVVAQKLGWARVHALLFCQDVNSNAWADVSSQRREEVLDMVLENNVALGPAIQEALIRARVQDISPDDIDQFLDIVMPFLGGASRSSSLIHGSQDCGTLSYHPWLCRHWRSDSLFMNVWCLQ